MIIRNITKNGLNLIKTFEGFSSKIYLDSAGLSTIGYGHLIHADEVKSFKSGINATIAEDLLRRDLIVAERAVIRLIDISLNNKQFDAIVSFTFNLGSASLQRSTLRCKINRSEHELVPAELLKWIWAGGKKLPGLLRRRITEGELYLA